jgi:hypothetical protein
VGDGGVKVNNTTRSTNTANIERRSAVSVRSMTMIVCAFAVDFEIVGFPLVVDSER